MISAICDLKYTTFTWNLLRSGMNPLCLNVTISRVTCITTPEGAPEVWRTSSDHHNVFPQIPRNHHRNTVMVQETNTATKLNTNFPILLDKFHSIQLNSKFYSNAVVICIVLFKHVSVDECSWDCNHHNIFVKRHVNKGKSLMSIRLF